MKPSSANGYTRAVTYRELTHIDELLPCEAIEQAVWGLPDREVLPASQLVAAVHAGGVVIGAFDSSKLIGFVYGFPAHRPEWQPSLGLHSHMVAVLPAYRGQGVGRRLKWLQRDWCLRRGITWMTWTFDPLQAKNAKLNLEHLGAVGFEYRINEYGAMSGHLNAGLPSDRLVALWQLDAPEVAVLTRRRRPPPDLDGPWLLREAAGEPQPGVLDPTAKALRLAVPPDVTLLLSEQPALALRWRLALREALIPALAQGFRATRFVGSSYLLTRSP